MEEALERIRWKSGNELLAEAEDRRCKKKMEETQYEEYMRIRAEEIKAGKSMREATDTAYVRAYCQQETQDQQSYKDR